MRSKKISLTAVFLALTLIVGIVEAKLPPILALIPYAKIGFSNIIILIAIILLGKIPALIMLIIKSIIIGIFTGNMMSILYSLSASTVSYIFMIIAISMSIFSFPVISAIAALINNFMQVAVASIVISNMKIFYYFPLLALIGLLAGYIVGLIALYVLKKLPAKFYDYVFKNHPDQDN